jgi:hypothetical protein
VVPQARWQVLTPDRLSAPPGRVYTPTRLGLRWAVSSKCPIAAVGQSGETASAEVAGVQRNN